ncbi:unnamed protein product [Prunus armeniaca]
MAEAMVVCNGVRRLGLAVGVMALFQRWVVRWVRVCRDALCVGDCRDGLCDGSVSKGMGCAVELFVNLMGCVCKRREFSMGGA